MVGPVSDDERDRFALKMKLGLTALIAASGGLIAVQGGASLLAVAAAIAGAAVIGAMLIWFVFPGSGSRSRGDDREPRFGN
jgi:lysozyme family protein